jgi:ActR/RegA family two-component response regulator
MTGESEEPCLLIFSAFPCAENRASFAVEASLRRETRPMAVPRPIQKMLVVDDFPPTRDSVRKLFEPLGREVLEASNSTEARAVAARERPDFILVDYNLVTDDGLESGLDLIPVLVAMLPGVRVALFSSDEDPMLAAAAVNAGAIAAYPKPFNLGDLVRAVERNEPTPLSDDPDGQLKLHQLQWDLMIRALDHTRGSRSRAAKRLGIDRTTLQKWMKKAPPPGREAWMPPPPPDGERDE